jgi:hypothetical protein
LTVSYNEVGLCGTYNTTHSGACLVGHSSHKAFLRATTRHGKNSVLGKVEASVERGGMVEEKTRREEENPISTAVVAGFVEESDVTEHEDPRLGTFEELPDELATLRGQIFANQGDLLDAIPW